MARKINNCPWCHKNDCVDTRAVNNAYQYKTGFHRVNCIYCGGALNVSFETQPRIEAVSKGNYPIDDWGQTPSTKKDHSV